MKASLRSSIYLKVIKKTKNTKLRIFGIYASRRLEKYGVFVSYRANIGDNLRLPHPVSIVIGDGVNIGSNVTIYQSVTLGGKVIGDWEKNNYPTIGDGTVIFAGAVVIGKVKIGSNCVIGANSVVMSDLPDNSVAVGAPARIVTQSSVVRKVTKDYEK